MYNLRSRQVVKREVVSRKRVKKATVEALQLVVPESIPAVAAMGNVNEKEEKQAECAVCLEVITARAVLQPCQHDFDMKCIIEWLKMTPSCPVCRRPVTHLHHDIKSDYDFKCHYLLYDAASQVSDQQVAPALRRQATHVIVTRTLPRLASAMASTGVAQGPRRALGFSRTNPRQSQWPRIQIIPALPYVQVVPR